MNIFNKLQSIFSPPTYSSVEEYAGDLNVDLPELKSTTIKVFQESGKVEAIKHVNQTIRPSKPLPLPSTYKFVNKLVNQLQGN
jgi:hypothetical protein